ncbi:hypothetical protein [Jatrophihabitans endophyticus]|nr:hypothetical protein [Jatrophihabitans endophyticus]
MSDDGTGTTDGYAVKIAPGDLDASIAQFRGALQHQNPIQMQTMLGEAMQVDAAFGDIPNATSAYGQLRDFVQSHLEAMQEMGVSLEDFVARVQAAAKLGYEADPATVAAAKQAEQARISRLNRMAY